MRYTFQTSHWTGQFYHESSNHALQRTATPFSVRCFWIHRESSLRSTTAFVAVAELGSLGALRDYELSKTAITKPSVLDSIFYFHRAGCFGFIQLVQRCCRRASDDARQPRLHCRTAGSCWKLAYYDGWVLRPCLGNHERALDSRSTVSVALLES